MPAVCSLLPWWEIWPGASPDVRFAHNMLDLFNVRYFVWNSNYFAHNCLTFPREAGRGSPRPAAECGPRVLSISKGFACRGSVQRVASVASPVLCGVTPPVALGYNRAIACRSRRCFAVVLKGTGFGRVACASCVAVFLCVHALPCLWLSCLAAIAFCGCHTHPVVVRFHWKGLLFFPLRLFPQQPLRPVRSVFEQLKYREVHHG